MPYLNGSMVDWAALRKLVLPALGAEEEGDSTARASGGARAADGHPEKKKKKRTASTASIAAANPTLFPVAAFRYHIPVEQCDSTQTEWRRCGPPGGFSLPVCFNDSDTELSTRDTPISDKVQMIIDSLRSTQSSLDMGDEIEGNVLPGQDGHTQACVAAVGSYVEKKSKAKSPPENQQTRPPSMNNHESSDSDSDDSVDRGIEEAILEYLKEKDDHKRKADTTFLHSSKIPRQHPPILGIFKHNSDSHSPLVSCNQIPRVIKTETLTTPTTIPLKKYLKNKASLDENFNLDKSPSINLVSTNEPIQTASKPTSLFNKTSNTSVTFKIEDDTTDSSSDDGIEEAIQKYQLEKKGHQSRRETFTTPSFKEESDSTSDDGIEEAIRCYQLEQQKEKPVLKPFLDRQKPLKKSLENSVGGTSSESKLKLKKKHSRADKQTRPFSNDSLPAVVPKPTPSQSSKGKGNGLLCFRPERFEEPPTYTPPKVNTTAELMCAEAILDISKTVMPGAFHHSLGVNSCGPTKSSEQPSLSNTVPLEESEDSSIDSEDGIEQEIRKFLEQKAQMHNQPPSSQDDMNEAEKLRAKEVQKKPQRLSLTQRRKQKVLQNMLGKDDDKKSLLEDMQESAELLPCRGAAQVLAAVHKTDRGGDKSSSLDSDEDLDTAIKDLLKTKKKSKKKIRDLKRKPKKGIRDEEPSSGNSLPTKKFKSEPFSRCSTLTKAHKQKDEMKDKLGLIKKNVSQQKHTDQSRTETQKEAKDFLHIVKAPPLEKDDSSSVDSDDSIEQEIRKFLAEKAKVSTTEKTKDGDVSRNGTVIVQGVGIKQESQLAEVSTKNPPLGSLSFAVPDATPQRLQSVISPTSALPRVLQPRGPSLLEPADGAGAARVEQGKANIAKQDPLDASKTAGRGRTVLSPNLSHSSAEANKWRQSLGLPLFDTKAVSRTPFLINTSEIKETPGSTFSNQNKSPKLQTSAGSWFASKTGRAPASCSKETDANPTVRPPVLNFYSAARQHPTMSFAHGLLPGHSSQFSVDEEKASTVHVPKDKSVFVELETNRTNHVQIQSRERREANERAQMLNDRKAEGKSVKIDVSADRRQEEEEEFIDETDCESDGRKDPGKKQGFSALSLGRAIDPGISISPCIALTSEERSRMFRGRYPIRKYNKGGPSVIPLQLVKRKLQFVADSRKKEIPTLQSGRG
ncbi:hypothetical protein OJAV_G00122450 [Oryzias javanicus]|uniref:Protein phosphatase 1 regulatory subunit 26 N-terminal domain-containing protein n=1 Tax=Oryzias javanicus TaxID=123683 RepID=A0A3S2PGA5_ORYJA|nr:hypothetical protein OJAV_G00122450 [Oryzias javanicus]